MQKLLRTGLALSLAAMTVVAMADSPAPTKKMMDAVYAKAKSSGKNVLVIFHASWCGWCHKLDGFLKEDTGKKLTTGLEIIHLDVLENDGPHKGDENPGGREFMATLGGAEAGLPFCAIVDAKGKMLINSNDPTNKGANKNIGYPAEPSEVSHFMKMLAVGAPKVSLADRKLIGEWLKVHAPKQG